MIPRRKTVTSAAGKWRSFQLTDVIKLLLVNHHRGLLLRLSGSTARRRRLGLWYSSLCSFTTADDTATAAVTLVQCNPTVRCVIYTAVLRRT